MSVKEIDGYLNGRGRQETVFSTTDDEISASPSDITYSPQEKAAAIDDTFQVNRKSSLHRIVEIPQQVQRSFSESNSFASTSYTSSSICSSLGDSFEKSLVFQVLLSDFNHIYQDICIFKCGFHKLHHRFL